VYFLFSCFAVVIDYYFFVVSSCGSADSYGLHADTADAYT